MEILNKDFGKRKVVPDGRKNKWRENSVINMWININNC